ncbi:MAG TPA: acetyltransferase [Pyrinomonadaceae bacterium]|nr:acetyltransferase [Pyrinomonadaceae bacterium]
MKRVIIIGAGGHGREVADILRHQAQHHPDLNLLGFIDEDRMLHRQVINDLPILGDWSWFESADRSEIAVICAVGLPLARRRLAEHARALGLSFINAISPLARLSPYTKIGEGVMIFPHSVTGTDSLIGDHAVLNVGATISHDTRIDRYCTLNPGVHLAGNVLIGEGGYLGIGSSVIHGVSIGAWTTVGAGAAVIRNLPDNVTAVGVPARVIKSKE